MRKELKRQIPWTKTLLEDFIQEALLTEDEEFIVRTRIAGWSSIKQSMERGLSTATISNIVKRCKEKYDNLHKQFPNRFPKRRIYEEDVNDSLQLIEKCLKCKYKNIDIISLDELRECYKNCPYKK